MAAPTSPCSTSEPVLDLSAEGPTLDLVVSPIWAYDSVVCCNIWGNRAALELFGVDEDGLRASQPAALSNLTAESRDLWRKLNSQIRQDVQIGKQRLEINVTSFDVSPGFLDIPRARTVLKATYKPQRIRIEGTEREVIMVQVAQQNFTDVEENHLRMVEMCNNHPMFQFLFDANGKLLAANKRAMYNMREHLGSRENYTLQSYLSIGECDGCLGPDEMYNEAMNAIFRENKPCHRFPQLRWSKRHPGKYRWVLYEMWPQRDPITGTMAVLVCEQNISQVKALEEQFKKQNQRLEAQLEEALAQRDPVHKPAIDIDTPADKTLKLLDKIMKGHEVSARDAMELRDAILQAGDLRQPVNFNEQLMKNSQTVLDSEVSQSLIQLLSSKRPAKIEEEPSSSSGRGAAGAGPTDGHSGGAAPHAPHGHGAHGGAAGGHGHAPGGPSHGHHGGGHAHGSHGVPLRPAHITPESVRDMIALSKNLPDKVMEVLAKVDDWQFDAFKLSEVSGGRPLSLLSYALLKRCELVEKWQLNEHKLVKFLMRIEDGYPNNPYHNRIHAADVLQSLHVLVVRGGLIEHSYCDEVALMSCYLSAIIHDFEHKGVNNDYLVRVSDGLAVLYNDRSPMENHHLAASFHLINTDEYNFMSKVPHKVKEVLRKQMIEMVLATDMKQHFAIHSTFQAKMQLGGSRPSGGGSGGKSVRGSPHSTSHEPIHRPMDEDLKSLVLQVALKCADLGHLASPRVVHKKWVQYLEEEFFRQGDREKQNALGVSPLMDREKNGITKSQVGFFDIVALPLFQSFAQAFADATPMLDAVKDNYAMWREEAAVYSQSASASAPSGARSSK